MNRKKVLILLTENTHRRIKAAAAMDGKSMSEWIEDMLVALMDVKGER